MSSINGAPTMDGAGTGTTARSEKKINNPERAWFHSSDRPFTQWKSSVDRRRAVF
jgi:hypothetical protein